MPPEIVSALLKQTWMEQACRRPADREAVFARLMAAAPASPDSSPNNFGRGSLKPAFDAAVAALVTAFGADAPPEDPVMAVWRIFTRLDREHCARLAALLMGERSHV